MVRSPTFTKLLSGRTLTGSSPLSRRYRGGWGGRRGGRSRTASAIARMWAGVVPQHPPTMLTSPCSANSRSTAAMDSGVSSYSPNSFGRPALGWVLTRTGATRDSSWTYGRSAGGPSAQLRPTLSGRACATEFQNASVVCPDRVRPRRVGDRARDHDRQPHAERLEDRLDREDRGLGVERVEDGLDEEQVGAAVEQRRRRLGVGRHQLVERRCSGSRDR